MDEIVIYKKDVEVLPKTMVAPQDIRCMRNHKVAELIGEEVYIKCKSCGHFVRITFKEGGK